MVLVSCLLPAASTSSLTSLVARTYLIEAGHRGLGPLCDQQMGLAGAGVVDQAERLSLLDPFAGDQNVNGGRIDAGIGVEAEVPQC